MLNSKPNKRGKSSIRWLPIILFISLLVPIGCIGFHLEYSPDSFFAVSFRGIINNIPFETFYIYMNYWDSVLNKLYALYSSVSWYGWMLVTYTILTIFIICIPLFKITRTLHTYPSLIIISSVVAIWSIVVFYIGFTRIPFYIIGAVWLFVITIKKSKRHQWLINSSLGLLIAGACFFRYESILAAIIVLLPTLLFVVFNQKEKFKPIAIRLIGIIGIGFIGIFVHHEIYNTTDDQLAREFYDLHFNFFDANQRVHPDNEQDSIRIQAMTMDFNADKDQLNIKEYRRLTIGHPLKVKDISQLEKKVNQFSIGISKAYSNNRFILYFHALLLIVTILICYKDRKNLFILLFNQLWILATIVGIIFFLKYTQRVTQPLIILSSISILTCLYYAKKSSFYLKSSITLSLFIVLFIFSYYSLLKQYQHIDKSLENRYKSNYQTLMTLSEIQKRENKDIILTNDAFELFQTGLVNEVTKDELTTFTFDTHINYLRGVEDAVEKYCGSTNLIDFYQYLSEQSNPPILISSKERIHMLTDYFKILYNYQFSVEDVSKQYFKQPISTQKSDLQLYTIETFQSY